MRHDHLWALTEGQRLRFLGAGTALLAANGCMFAAPLIAKSAIDALLGSDVPAVTRWLLVPLARLGQPAVLSYLLLAALVSLLLTALGGFFQYTQTMLTARAAEAVVQQLRDALFRRLQHLPAAFYDTAETGDLVQRCSSDVATLGSFLAGNVVAIARAGSLLLTVTPLLFWLHVPLAWTALALMPLVTWSAYVYFKRIRVIYEKIGAAESAMTAVMQENLTGCRVVRAFARQDYESAKFAAKNTAYYTQQRSVVHVSSTFWGISDGLCELQLGIVLIVGAYWTIGGTLTLGTLYAFLSCAGMVVWPMRELGYALTESGQAMVSLGRVSHILSAPEEPVAPAPSLARVEGDLRLEQVTFGYDPARPVIHGLSLHVRAGETLAIVGAPGAGKSTLIRLLLGLYPLQAGVIRLDGEDIAGASSHWLREQIGVVMQDPFLYSRTIEENLRVGRPTAEADELQRAMREAALHDTVATFRDGYDTLIGERGVTLSGGQRQRLALARALLKEPPVLVLDDSLSAIDTGTEAHILSALRARKGKNTTLVIAHRLSSLIHADRILVLEHGRVVQLGDHATLSQSDGPYRRIVRIQTALETEISADIRVTA